MGISDFWTLFGPIIYPFKLLKLRNLERKKTLNGRFFVCFYALSGGN